MRVLVCGGRDYTELDRIEEVCKELKEITVLIQGGAKGADDLAFTWATSNNIETETYVAKWKELGKKAGYIRNKQMLEEGKPDLVIAFPGGKGTANMVKLAREANIEVKEIT